MAGGETRAGRGDGATLGARLRAGDRTAAPAALNVLETRNARDEAAALVSAAGDGDGHVVGVTGPPGVGKSTLLSGLLREWRSRGRSVAVLAVDPSSKRSGGALLGDRARIEHDPADRDVFIRSMAAGERLGGLAPATRAAAQALANAFDVVVIETVGVGQSETDVAEAADTVAVIVQPGSGDALQFLKAGIMEVPDVLVVTKADLGATARRAEQDLRAALGALGARGVPVLAVSSIRPTTGIDALADALQAHRDGLDRTATRTRVRRLGALADFLHEHGERGLRALGGRRAARRWLERQEPGLYEPELLRRSSVEFHNLRLCTSTLARRTLGRDVDDARAERPLAVLPHHDTAQRLTAGGVAPAQLEGPLRGRERPLRVAVEHEALIGLAVADRPRAQVEAHRRLAVGREVDEVAARLRQQRRRRAGCSRATSG